ncbi:hypothetical protein H257_03604 [Aphanomyces astaci]|uniref:Uncharacterized protein n=1 Tax=Aphanomyces astaci TaxID=112090 RepID=W4GXC3_APHAT|nr:hypothetical protein H257_03604 [Aphanomyces astaci]ETV84380.1 hypothetical protein H257_03604 [Aphanomyces astaci]|eukprot:XP_009826072.1 hypothetical protein H257_03604 [Aphanomyces astaci]
MEVMDDITIVHFWGACPDAKVFKKPSTCTIPPYKSKDDIKGILVEPKEFALSLDARTKRLVRSFTYTIGCSDVPPSVEDGGAITNNSTTLLPSGSSAKKKRNANFKRGCRK